MVIVLSVTIEIFSVPARSSVCHRSWCIWDNPNRWKLGLVHMRTCTLVDCTNCLVYLDQSRRGIHDRKFLNYSPSLNVQQRNILYNGAYLWTSFIADYSDKLGWTQIMWSPYNGCFVFQDHPNLRQVNTRVDIILRFMHAIYIYIYIYIYWR